MCVKSGFFKGMLRQEYGRRLKTAAGRNTTLPRAYNFTPAPRGKSLISKPSSLLRSPFALSSFILSILTGTSRRTEFIHSNSRNFLRIPAHPLQSGIVQRQITSPSQRLPSLLLPFILLLLLPPLIIIWELPDLMSAKFLDLLTPSPLSAFGTDL